jgi:glycosyltransferase involved in cell wall biosynthesis
MKLLLAANLPYYPALGGANKANRKLLELLANKGHQVRAVVSALGVPSHITLEEIDRDLADQSVRMIYHDDGCRFELCGVEVHAIVRQSLLRNYMVKQIKDYQPNCVILSSEEPAQNLLEAALKTCPGRVVYLLHTPNFLPFGPLAFYPGKRRASLFRGIAEIVAVSEFCADYLHRWSGLNSTVCYLPVYGTGPFPQLGDFDRGFVTMINPCRYKGIDIFLSLARELPKVQFAAVPTWGTTSHDRAALEGLPNVRLLTPSLNFDDILAQTRVLLMPSLWLENFPMTIIEGMLRGIPTLASDIGGIPEAKLGTNLLLPVRPIERFTAQLDENQLLIPVVPEQDISPWRDTLYRLLTEIPFYRRESAAAREAASRFVTGLSIEPFEMVLQRVAEQASARLS